MSIQQARTSVIREDLDRFDSMHAALLKLESIGEVLMSYSSKDYLPSTVIKHLGWTIRDLCMEAMLKDGEDLT